MAEEHNKSSIMPKLLISGFITLVVVAETFIFFFMVPSSNDVAALAEARLVEKLEANLKDRDESEVDPEATIIEFPLGEHAIAFQPPGTDRNYRVEFRLFGTIKQRDEKRLKELYDERKGRFRHRLMLEIRNATMDELTENQLGLIQRRILATSNEILGEPILLGVGFNDFQVYEG